MNDASNIFQALLEKDRCPIAVAKKGVPPLPGYYAIFVDSPKSLPKTYGSFLEKRRTCLLYIGIATKSLLQRLIEQNMEHKHPSTFFRGIAPILGFRPPIGSLVERRNQNNYFFSKDDTLQIVEWLEKHLFVSWVQDSSTQKQVESEIIKLNRPLLNTQHNPDKLEALAQLRKECRMIAMMR